MIGEFLLLLLFLLCLVSDGEFLNACCKLLDPDMKEDILLIDYLT